MFQLSVDRSHGNSKFDLFLFISLIVLFFGGGAIMLALEKALASSIPRYVFFACALAVLFVIYRVRIVGYRYTVFYEAPKPVYDPRFDDMMLHEDYPYPVGTLVFERIVSAKGTILFTVDRSEIVALALPGEAAGDFTEDQSLNLACQKEQESHSLYFRKDGKLIRLYFAPDEEFLACLEKALHPEQSEAEAEKNE